MDDDRDPETSGVEGKRMSSELNSTRVIVALSVLLAAGSLCGWIMESKKDSKTAANVQVEKPVSNSAGKLSSGANDGVRDDKGAIASAERAGIERINSESSGLDRSASSGRNARLEDEPGQKKRRASRRTARGNFKDLVPPPPYIDNDELPVSELPDPPEAAPKITKPRYLPALMYLRLTAIVGEKAILLVPGILQKQNDWPRSFSVGKGDILEDARNHQIEVASVTADGVVLQQRDGERYSKTLAPIR